MTTKPIRSPAYPSMSLGDALAAVGKIEAQYRSSPVDRENGAKLIGYSSLSGPANKALAALASFGLVERAGKGMMKVTTRARMILHAHTAQERFEALRQAATEPQLFKDIRERFPDIELPPEDGVRTYLNREGFNPTAVGPAAKAFLETVRYIEEQGASESHSGAAAAVPESNLPDDRFGGAVVGDLIQWESGGALQFEIPRRVRWVSDDGAWLAVEGSDTGIPMEQAIVETPAKNAAPHIPPSAQVQMPETAPTKAGQRKAVFPVSEGDVTFVFPEGLTIDGLEELEMYLDVFLKKEKRKATQG